MSEKRKDWLSSYTSYRYAELYSSCIYSEFGNEALVERRRQQLKYISEYMFPLLCSSFPDWEKNQEHFILADRNGIIAYSTETGKEGKLVRSTKYSGPEMLDLLHKAHFISVTANEVVNGVELERFYGMWYVLRDISGEPFAIIMSRRWKPNTEEYVRVFCACCQAVQTYCEFYTSQQSLIDAIPFAVLITGTNGRIRQVNQTAQTYAGGTLVGKRIDDLSAQGKEPPKEESCGKYGYILGHKVLSDRKIEHVGQFGTSERRIILLSATANCELERKNQEENDSCSAIIGNSPVMLAIKNTIRLIAQKPVSVLIQGESGTGKELVARAIHRASGRRGRFIPINCGAMDRNLLYSELFGYEEGSFTGASRGGKKGKIELSDGGTLFLDEIGEMPVDMQVSLLRVLEERSVMPVGGKCEKKVDIRVVAATNRNLKQEIHLGNFREDLYFRLAVIPIHVPPLRERKEDIPRLIQKFTQQISKDYDKDEILIPNDVLEAMKEYSWYGNVRELRNTLEYMVLMSNDGEITRSLLEKTMQNVAFGEERRKGFMEDGEAGKKDEILAALAACGNNKSKAAKLLGISRKTLYVWMAQYGIDY